MLSLGVTKLLVDEIVPQLSRRESVVCLARSGILGCDFQPIIAHLRATGHTPTLGPYTGRELFLDLGFKQYDDIDFVPDEGVSIVHDLNLPYNGKSYDFVFECGTMEHIFDIAQVFRNMVSLCNVGGTVCHVSPLTWLNHGFYNFSLTLFYDVYRTNGFEDFNFWFINWPRNYIQTGSSQALKVQFTPVQIMPPTNSDFLMVAFTATKTKSQPFQNPTQAAYDKTLALNTPLRKHNHE